MSSRPSLYYDAIEGLGHRLGANPTTVSGWIQTWPKDVPDRITPAAWDWACSEVGRQHRAGTPYPGFADVLETAERYSTRPVAANEPQRKGCPACAPRTFEVSATAVDMPGHAMVASLTVVTASEGTRTYHYGADDLEPALPDLQEEIQDWSVSVSSCRCTCPAGRAIAAAVQAVLSDPNAKAYGLSAGRSYSELIGREPPLAAAMYAVTVRDRLRAAALATWGERGWTRSYHERQAQLWAKARARM